MSCAWVPDEDMLGEWGRGYCMSCACVCVGLRETRGRVDRVRFNFCVHKQERFDRVELVLRRGEVLDDGDLVAAQVELAVLERAQEGRRARYQICGERHKARPQSPLYRVSTGPRGADRQRKWCRVASKRLSLSPGAVPASPARPISTATLAHGAGTSLSGGFFLSHRMPLRVAQVLDPTRRMWLWTKRACVILRLTTRINSLAAGS